MSLAACGEDATEPVITPPLGITVSTPGLTSLTVSFNSTAGDDRYEIERAEGSAGTFSLLTTVNAPATAGPVTYADNGLKVNTLYRYRITAIRGARRSSASSEISGTTLNFGAAGRVDITTDVTSTTTWTADKVYVLKGFIHVANGATLNIEAGTRIEGDFNTLGASLFVLRGARINAIGTAAAPIVFTSSQAVGSRKPGDWGGLILVGNATMNRTGVDVQLEGSGTASGTTSGANYSVLYSGGTTDTDNSGELRYVRVEFAGYAPSINNELNSFSFAAVGSGTRLSFLQSLAGLDDSFEWWGGTVDASNLVSYESGDDHFDVSEGYRGRLQNLIALQTTQLTPRTGAGSPSSDPQGIENDGCEGAGCTLGRNSTPLTVPVVANFTLIGTGDVASSGTSGGVGVMLRRGTGGFYVNGVVARWPRAAVSVRDAETYVRGGSTATQDLVTSDLAVKNLLFLDSPTIFQSGGSSTQNSLDLAGNALTNSTGAVTVQQLFTAFPATVSDATTASAFDWTPVAGSAATSGGLSTFTGKLSTASGSVVTGTAYRGAANPAGPRWWQTWTAYARN
ncbi:MAG: hypothetical protein ACT4OZ_15915 [Gemmatimonadota bacterium]